MMKKDLVLKPSSKLVLEMASVTDVLMCSQVHNIVSHVSIIH